MSERIYNFSAGPAMMPEAVLLEAQAELLDWHGTGMSVAEMSHRSGEFESIASEAVADLRELLRIPDDYEVLFLQGGATGQFAAVPLNLATETDNADYVVTGMWSKKAVQEASRFLSSVYLAAKTTEHTYVPKQQDWQSSDNPAYVHITPNETIDGLAFDYVPDTDAPLVADMSSLILSEPLDVNKYGVIYAGSQKNIGPAGLTVVIVRQDLIGNSRPATPAIWNWKAQAEQGSMINTPPTVAWYMAGLVFKWLKEQGGVGAIAEINKRKAEKLYIAIDESELYKNSVRKPNRSRMNVPFSLSKPELDSKFRVEAAQERLVNLEGHRSVGGIRASIYNAMPESGVDALVEFMAAFEASRT